MTAWAVPGYDTLELLGFGTSGELWRARERGSGALVALRRIAGGDREAVARVRRDAIVVRSLASPHLVRLRSIARAGADDVLVLDHADGGSVASLLARRGALEPGEVVTAVAPLAEVLAQAHGRGLVHGRLTAASVLLTADGMPLLDGLGMACLVDAEDTLDPTGGLGAAADIWALGALAHLLLTGREAVQGVPLAAVAPTAPVPLVRAVESALAFDPTARPGAKNLAAGLLAACPPLPLRGLPAVAPAALPDPPPLPALPRRTALLASAAAVSLLAVVAIGWAWRRGTAPHAATVRAPAGTPAGAADWGAVLRALDRARGRAFAAADVSLLDAVYVPGSDPLRADADVVAGFARTRRTAVGVEHAFRSVTPLHVAPDRVELRVVQSLLRYDVLDAAGGVVARHPEGLSSTRVLVLAWGSRGWRVGAVLASA